MSTFFRTTQLGNYDGSAAAPYLPAASAKCKEPLLISSCGLKLKLKILVYHQIVSGDSYHGDYPWAVTVSQLRRHLELLREWGFKTISFKDYSAYTGGATVLPNRCVILTFDDGYEEMYQNALTLLMEFGAKATFFVLGDRSLGINNWDHKRGFDRMNLIEDHKLIEMHNAGYEVGSHSMTHPVLTEVSTELAEKEIRDSKSLLENLVQEEVTTFAYPHGATNDFVKKIVEAAGYSYGCGVYSGPPKFGGDMYDIRRIPMTRRTNAIEFALKMMTPYEHYAWLRWEAGKRLRGFAG